MPLPIWTNAQVIAQLDSGYHWSGTSLTYAFPTVSRGMYADGNEKSGFQAATVNQQGFISLALKTWDDLIAPNFSEIPFTQSSITPADVEFGYSTSMGSGYAWAYYPTDGSVWFSKTVGQDLNNSTTAPIIGRYGFETLVHEIGHALGLDHMGNYNAGSGQPATPSSYQDSTVYSIMSYFGPGGSDNSPDVAQADWTGADNIDYSPQTPMLNDVMAIQSIYGASTTTRTDNTVYGFSSTITGNSAKIFDFSINLYPILTLFDSAGNDTLNLSGWSTPSTLSLESGVYSSCNSMTDNLVIAYGCVIENAIGGSGNDTITGNTIANQLDGGAGDDSLNGGVGNDTLTGGQGNDSITGGDGSDTAVFAGAFSSYQIGYSQINYSFTIAGAASGIDVVFGVEFFQFADGTRATAQLISSDNTAPTLTSLSPVDNAAGIAAGSNLVLTFSEAVQAGAGNIIIYNGDGTVARTIAITDASQVTVAGNTLTINPTTDLADGSSYYVNLGTGVILDLAGNSFAGLSGSTAYNFSTAVPVDSTAPTVSFSDNVAGTATGQITYSLTFSEAVTGLATNDFTVTNGNVISISGAGANYSVVVAPAANTEGTLSLTLKAGAVTDTAPIANANAAATASPQAIDTRAPTVNTLVPVDGAMSVNVAANITLTFSEAIQRGTGTLVLMTTDGTPLESFDVATSTRLTLSGSTLTVNPIAVLDYSTGYRFELATGSIKDLAGNPFAGLSTYNFTTAAAPDLTAPVPAFTDDSAGTATGDVTYSLTFTEAVNGLAVNDFTVDNGSVISISGAGASYTVVVAPATDTEGVLAVTLKAGAVTDAAGNPNAIATAAAQAIDTRAPAVVALADATGAASVGTDSPIRFTFSEVIERGVGSIVLRTDAGALVESFDVASSARLSIAGNTLTIDPTTELDVFTAYRIEFSPGAVRDLAGNPFAASSTYGFTTGTVDGLYHFFIVAFDAAPGVVYMGQLAEAWNFGLSLQEIVDIFTTKAQFTDSYPLSLTHAQLASELVTHIIKSSASAEARAEAVADVTAALDAGWSRGEVIYTVFGNLAAKPLDDAKWGGTAQQFHHEIDVARYYTETLHQGTTDLPTLRAVIAGVTQSSDTSSPEKIQALIDAALLPHPASAALASMPDLTLVGSADLQGFVLLSEGFGA